jgi:hypothetical protein
VPTTFIDDDAGFMRWRDTHLAGYVINHDRAPRAAYLKLHHAACRTLQGLSPSRRRQLDYDLREDLQRQRRGTTSLGRTDRGTRPLRYVSANELTCSRCATATRQHMRALATMLSRGTCCSSRTRDPMRGCGLGPRSAGSLANNVEENRTREGVELRGSDPEPKEHVMPEHSSVESSDP